jgi:fumarylacetoacetate (FAA) hydrolase family protein
LRNRVVITDQAARWNFGVADLMRNLSGRGLL